MRWKDVSGSIYGGDPSLILKALYSKARALGAASASNTYVRFISLKSVVTSERKLIYESMTDRSF